MRQMISGLVAAIAVVAASAAPAMACGGGLFQTPCSPCGEAYVPCAQPQVYVAPVYVAPVYSGCDPCGGWVHERLPDPVQQYYYVNQGPTFTGPGNWAPRPTYQEGAVWGRDTYHHHPHYHYYGHYHAPYAYRYGYFHHHVYAHHYGYREHTLRRYY
jgi:hypothetical protein